MTASYIVIFRILSGNNAANRVINYLFHSNLCGLRPRELALDLEAIVLSIGSSHSSKRLSRVS
jgi:hypothetical protein